MIRYALCTAALVAVLVPGTVRLAPAQNVAVYDPDRAVGCVPFARGYFAKGLAELAGIPPRKVRGWHAFVCVTNRDHVFGFFLTGRGIVACEITGSYAGGCLTVSACGFTGPTTCDE